MKMQYGSATARAGGKAANDNAPSPPAGHTAPPAKVTGLPTVAVMRVAVFGGGLAMLGSVKRANDQDVEATAANKPPPAS